MATAKLIMVISFLLMEPGEIQPPVKIPPSGTKECSVLDSYVSVPVVALKTTDIEVPQTMKQIEKPAWMI